MMRTKSLVEMENKDWYVDIESAKKYQDKLNNGKLVARYFSSGKNAQIEKDLIENPINTTKNIMAMNRIVTAMGIIRRYLTDTPVGFDEVISAKGKKKKYLSGDGDFEFAAWAVVQSYLIGGICKPQTLRAYFPIGCGRSVINKWNSCIDKIDGINTMIKTQFMIDDNGDATVLKYINAWADDYGLVVYERKRNEVSALSYPSKESRRIVAKIAKNNSKNDPVNKEHPEDDVPVAADVESSNKVIIDAVVKDGIVVEVGSKPKKEPKRPEKEAESPNPVKNHLTEKEHPEDDTHTAKDVEATDSEVVANATSETVTEKEESVPVKVDDEKIDLKAKAEIKIPVTFMPGKSSKMPFVKFDVGEQSKVNLSANDQIDNIYKEANDIWEQAFPGLDKITSLIHKAGFYVNYMVNPAFDTQRVFNADIISKEGVWLRSFLIDYYCITHDAIRIGFLTDPTGDVFSGIWVSSYQKHENLALKMITGTLTEEDIKKIISKYPENIRLVSRMVDLEEIPDDIPYPKWRALVNRIANVVQNMPAHARFRLVNYKSATDWTLACARNVNISFINKNDPRTRDINFNTTREKGLFVDYSEEKYKDYNGYIVGFTDGSDLPFDPYANLDKDDKKAS